MPAQPRSPLSADLMPLLWKAGLKGFYDESCGWRKTPDSLAAWSETSLENQARLSALLAGPVLTWLKYVHPKVYREVESARKGPIPNAMVLRAMGLPAPEMVVVGNPSFDFGAIPEGRSATLPITVANRGPRGVANLSVTFATMHADIHSSLGENDCLLGPGMSKTIEVTAVVPQNRRTVVSDASLEVRTDNDRILAAYPIRFRSAVPRSRKVKYVIAGLTTLCCAGTVVTAQKVLHYKKSQAEIQASFIRSAELVNASAWKEALAELDHLSFLSKSMTPEEGKTIEELC